MQYDSVVTDDLGSNFVVSASHVNQIAWNEKRHLRIVKGCPFSSRTLVKYTVPPPESLTEMMSVQREIACKPLEPLTLKLTSTFPCNKLI